MRNCKKCFGSTIINMLIVQVIFLMTTHRQPRLIIRLTDNLHSFTKYIGKIENFACGNAMKVFKSIRHIRNIRNKNYLAFLFVV